MSSNYWLSSHYNHWIVDRITLERAREDDLKYATAEQLALISIFFANMIGRLGKRLNTRQQVIATATVYFRRFYLKNSYCDTDPYLVMATCCYVASKIEEQPLHFKQVVLDARALLSDEYDIESFPSDHHKLAEMEFYLIEDLDFHLVVYHPYRTLMQLCGEPQARSTNGGSQEIEEGEETSDRRFAGTGKGGLHMSSSAVQQAWYIINDTYRGDFCLIYPPHLIAIAAVFLCLVLCPQTVKKGEKSNPAPRYQTRSKHPAEVQQTPADFLASLNVNYSTITTITQEILSLWSMWALHPDNGQKGSDLSSQTPPADGEIMDEAAIVALLASMREGRERDFAHPANGRPPPFRPFERQLEAAASSAS